MIKISLKLHKLCEILITSFYLKYTSQDSHKDKQNNEDEPRKTAHSTANVSYFLVFLCSWSCYHLAFGTDASSQTVLLKSPSILSLTVCHKLHFPSWPPFLVPRFLSLTASWSSSASWPGFPSHRTQSWRWFCLLLHLVT